MSGKTGLKFSRIKKVDLNPKSSGDDSIHKIDNSDLMKPDSIDAQTLTDNNNLNTPLSPQTKNHKHIKGFERKKLTSDPILAKKAEEEKRIPAFLRKLQTQTAKFDFGKIFNNNENKDTNISSSDKKENLNSITNIFKSDHEQIHGIKRVFRKSLIMMVIDSVFFAFLIYASTNLFTLWLLPAFVLFVFSATTTILFYLILADRSYMLISLLIKAILAIILYSFIGQGFSVLSILGILAVVLFFYLGYTELEKFQLSSRLFSISHVAQESVRIISTGLVLLVVLSVYNQGAYKGGVDFVTESFLEKDWIMDTVIIGTGRVSLNSSLMDGDFRKSSDSENIRYSGRVATFADFLTENYRKGEEVITKAELENIELECELAKQKGVCSERIDAETNKRLEEWRFEAYGELDLELDTPLNSSNFKEVSLVYYQNEIEDFQDVEDELDEAGNEDSSASNLAKTLADFQIVSPSSIFPALISVLLLVVLMLIKFILQWVIQITLLIVWNILKLFGFVRIEVETVEAEVVSI